MISVHSLRPMEKTHVQDDSAPCGSNGTSKPSGVRLLLSKDEEIYDEGEPVRFVYFVVTGMVRVCKQFSDGRRHITEFYVPGDMFGLERGSEHYFSASAVVASEVVGVKPDQIMSLAAASRAFALELWTIANRELDAAQRHILHLAKSAPDRMMTFLLDMAARLKNDDEVDLPMTRREIADHLGLTVETVCRILSSFQKSSVITLASPHHVTLNLSDRASVAQNLGIAHEGSALPSELAALVRKLSADIPCRGQGLVKARTQFRRRPPPVSTLVDGERGGCTAV